MWSLLVLLAPALLACKWYWYKRTADRISKKYNVNVEFGVYGLGFYNKNKNLPPPVMEEIVKASSKDRIYNLAFAVAVSAVVLISGLIRKANL